MEAQHRVSVWRKLKEAGALYVQNSVCLLPAGPDSTEKASAVGREIKASGGWCAILKTEPLGPGDQAEVILQFNQAREKEYSEVLDRCNKFVREIEEETARGNFSFAEVEENEDDLHKLERWYNKIKARDFYRCPMQEEVALALGRCGQLLADFTKKVYDREA